MLIRIAAELAASALVKELMKLFNIKMALTGGTGPGGGGGAAGTGGATASGFLSMAGSVAAMVPGGQLAGAITAGIGGIAGMLGFADGGWVPGPVGAPRAAVVHGGELVLNPQQLSTLGGITITGDMHFHGVRDVGTFQRQLGDYLDKIGRTRQGSG
jgi:hypothetical protein